MMKKTSHYLIVGQGLAGTCVAYQLIKSGFKVSVIDSGVNHSSKIAAGLINPIVFRRMTKSWRLDAFTNYLKHFYKALEHDTNNSFFHPITIRRMFAHQQERDLWVKKSLLPEFQEYLNPLSTEDDEYSKANNICGSGRVKNAFYVDVNLFLSSMRNWIQMHGDISQEDFDYSALEGTTYHGIDYSGIIFCEGYQGKNNPLFKDLPIGQTKGETLTIQSSEIPENESVNRKCFVLPLGSKQFKVGSTYVWHTPDVSITEEGKQTMLENLAGLGYEKIDVIQQEAGVRPTSLDRRPIIGEHPKLKGVFMFNGLGTKGYMIAPLLSKEFVEHLTEGAPLNTEVTISRFTSL